LEEWHGQKWEGLKGKEEITNIKKNVSVIFLVEQFKYSANRNGLSSIIWLL